MERRIPLRTGGTRSEPSSCGSEISCDGSGLTGSLLCSYRAYSETHGYLKGRENNNYINLRGLGIHVPFKDINDYFVTLKTFLMFNCNSKDIPDNVITSRSHLLCNSKDISDLLCNSKDIPDNIITSMTFMINFVTQRTFMIYFVM